MIQMIGELPRQVDQMTPSSMNINTSNGTNLPQQKQILAATLNGYSSPAPNFLAVGNQLSMASYGTK